MKNNLSFKNGRVGCRKTVSSLRCSHYRDNIFSEKHYIDAEVIIGSRLIQKFHYIISFHYILDRSHPHNITTEISKHSCLVTNMLCKWQIWYTIFFILCISWNIKFIFLFDSFWEAKRKYSNFFRFNFRFNYLSKTV